MCLEYVQRKAGLSAIKLFGYPAKTSCTISSSRRVKSFRSKVSKSRVCQSIFEAIAALPATRIRLKKSACPPEIQAHGLP
jgi:hypothetical protein